MQRRTFSAQTKLEAVNAVIDGASIKSVSEGLTLHENVLRRWIKDFKSKGALTFENGGTETSNASEIERLKKQVAKLKAERDALAKGKRPPTLKNSVTRGILLDATEQIMVEEGYAAVSTRRVAKKVGVTPALVHYYFSTTDDLLLAAFRRKKELHDLGVTAALASDNPIRGLWNFYNDTHRTAIGIEFRAMVNNRKVIRHELANDIEESRRAQIAGLTDYFRRIELDQSIISPVSLAVLISNMGRSFVTEETLGVTYGHAETKRFIDRLLNDLEKLVAQYSFGSDGTTVQAARPRKRLAVAK